MVKILKFPNVVERASENTTLQNRHYNNRMAEILIFPGVRTKQFASDPCKIPDVNGPRWKIDVRTISNN